jgi:hypothetical protein
VDRGSRREVIIPDSGRTHDGDVVDVDCGRLHQRDFGLVTDDVSGNRVIA